MNEFADTFRRTVRGEVRDDPLTRGAYATDAGIHQIMPALVIEPLDRADVLAALAVCRAHRLPIRPRGGGTSLTGQPLGSGVVLDCSRHLNRVLEINPSAHRVRVEPGITRDALNRALKPHGRQFAPDPATTSRATIGGMIATNAAGMRSIQYGMTIDHVEAVDLALADGRVLSLGPVDRPDGPEATALMAIIAREQEEILARFPKTSRRSGGYALDALTGPPPWNLARIVVGSEGTLGVTLEATLRLTPLPQHHALCLAHFTSVDAALRAVPGLLEAGPSALELLDGGIVRQARQHPLTRELCRMIEGAPEGLLVIEVQGDTPAAVADGLHRIRAALNASPACFAAPVMDHPDAIRSVWRMRESALGLIDTKSSGRKPIPYIEDASVPPAALADYVRDATALVEQHHRQVAVFGHAGAGVIHLRPLHDLRDPDDVALMLKIQDEVFALARRYGAAWSGEHGDGIIRGAYNRAFFGERLYSAFTEVKAIFDPLGLMNPGKKVDALPRDADLRPGPVKSVPLATGFRWEREGGLLAAAEACTGLGVCRKRGTGVMCPSYMATGDELHSTRGRANTVRMVLSGLLNQEQLDGDAVHAVLDYCLACQGCKSECPNAVDVGKMKAEALYQRNRKYGLPLRARILSAPGSIGRLATGWPAPTVNALLRNPVVRGILEKTTGLDARRPLPRFARETFCVWFAKRSATLSPERPPVALLVDPYTDAHEPEIGRAAVHVLEAAGYSVMLLPSFDSQRPALSQGRLNRAARAGAAQIRRLLPHARAGIPLLVLEPSCATALQQDLPDLVPNHDEAEAVADCVMMVDAFLAEQYRKNTVAFPAFTACPGTTIFFHPHCHQRALDEGRATLTLLEAIPGATIIMSEAGCCGMAGGFGYEARHYDLSLAIAEDRLLPALRTLPAEAVVLAGGFSCRHQITDLAGRKAQHPLDFLATLVSGDRAVVGIH